MEKIILNDVDEEFFYEKLDNGLEVFMIPKTSFSDVYATFTTKFGSVNTEFVPIGSKKMTKFNEGIAHFLEHKMFESEDGIDPFDFYSKNGASCNAYTSYDKTTYLFLGPGHLEENINYLLDFVQSIYLTEENVEKEKGIIEQEINMYKDDPMWMVYEGILANSFNSDHIRYPVAGEVSDIMKITVDELNKCYNTFYHPSNMFLTVTGNFEPEELIKIVRNNQKKKHYEITKNVLLKQYDEKDAVVKKYYEKEAAIAENKMAYAFKIAKDKIPFKDDFMCDKFIGFLTSSLFGGTSLFVKEGREKNILIDFGTEVFTTKSHYLITIFVDTPDPDSIIDLINKTVKCVNISEDDFERRKKVRISNVVSSYDSITQMNEIVISNVIDYGKFIDNQIELIRNFNYSDFKKFVKSIDFSNTSIYVVKPIKESN